MKTLIWCFLWCSYARGRLKNYNISPVTLVADTKKSFDYSQNVPDVDEKCIHTGCFCTAKYSKIKLYSVIFDNKTYFMSLLFWGTANISCLKCWKCKIPAWLSHTCNLFTTFTSRSVLTKYKIFLKIQNNFFFTTKTARCCFSSVTLPHQNSRFPCNESPDSHRAQPFPYHLKTSVA